jgi:hypothetical protein
MRPHRQQTSHLEGLCRDSCGQGARKRSAAAAPGLPIGVPVADILIVIQEICELVVVVQIVCLPLPPLALCMPLCCGLLLIHILQVCKQTAVSQDRLS